MSPLVKEISLATETACPLTQRSQMNAMTTMMRKTKAPPKRVSISPPVDNRIPNKIRAANNSTMDQNTPTTEAYPIKEMVIPKSDLPSANKVVITAIIIKTTIPTIMTTGIIINIRARARGVVAVITSTKKEKVTEMQIMIKAIINP